MFSVPATETQVSLTLKMAVSGWGTLFSNTVTRADFDIFFLHLK
jgi:hypothetical protein